MKRERKQPPPGDFVDPLSNYDGLEYSDDLERSLNEDTAQDVAATPCTQCSPDMTIAEVIQLMDDEVVGCVVIADKNKPIGIFSERDVLNRVAGRFLQIRDQPISSIMTPDPAFAYRDDPPARVLNMMATGGYRHVPVVNADEKLVGLIGARRITQYLQKHFS